MGTIAILFMYANIIGVISIVAYFVIKKAVKDALREYYLLPERKRSDIG